MVSFKQFTTLTETSNPIHVRMTLQQVINDGKISNTVQAIIIAQVIETLKKTNNSIVRDMNEFPAFSTTNISSIKALPPEGQVEVAQTLLSQINKEFEISSGGIDQSSSPLSWVNSVLQPQK